MYQDVSSLLRPSALPLRVYRALPPFSSYSSTSLRTFKWPARDAIFRPLRAGNLPTPAGLMSPYMLTRREMLSSIKALTETRDDAARKIGVLASESPLMAAKSRNPSVQSGMSPSIGAMRTVLGRPAAAVEEDSQTSLLLSILTTQLPQYESQLDEILTTHQRPSAITRLWFPMLFLPPALYAAASTIARNKAWMKQQISNAGATIQGFFVQWVWEPLEGIGSTMRTGGEGLGVAPTTVKSDQAVSGLRT